MVWLRAPEKWHEPLWYGTMKGSCRAAWWRVSLTRHDEGLLQSTTMKGCWEAAQWRAPLLQHDDGLLSCGAIRSSSRIAWWRTPEWWRTPQVWHDEELLRSSAMKGFSGKLWWRALGWHDNVLLQGDAVRRSLGTAQQGPGRSARPHDEELLHGTTTMVSSITVW